MSPDHRVVIWRSALLSGSETFVRNHGDHLTRWQPAYLGATRTDSALARETDVIAYPWQSDRLPFLRLRLTGESPRLRRLLALARPTLVHAHFAGDGWLINDSARRLGVPLIVTTHGHDVTRQPDSGGLKGIRYRRNLRSVFDRASLIIAVSEVIRERAIARGAEPSRVRVHYTGVPVPPAFSPVPPSWDVTFIGRFVDKKGADDLVAALGMLLPTRPRALFIGDGPLRPAVEAQARSLGVDATFTGSLPPAEVSARLAASRMLAAPSRTAADGDTEGLPTTVLEAGALGVPVVSTFHSGIPEAVIDGTTGLLGPERDVAALSRNILRLLSDDQLRARMGRAARAHITVNFNLATQSRGLEDLYDEVLAGHLQPAHR
ncbi:glycosyltransferase [Actinoplanes sp. NPDC051343]|uniref:glycosyltransferase n=1 Tax=Actinoplanes sp. NPDC051343 TaxID=3363906 RepID=UPI0037A3DD4F